MREGLKLFIKEHLSYILFQVVVVLFILMIYWLEGFRNLDTAIYTIVMSILLICSFLTIRYMLRRRYLGKITELPQRMDDALQKNAKTAEYYQTEKYMQELYRHYQHEVQSLYASQGRQYKFTNQWIHQMKTPVAVLELLLQEESLDKRSVQEEVDRLKGGLEMVLMNARLENFEEDLQVEAVNLKQLVTSTINDNKRLFIAKRVFPEVDIGEDIVVMSDSKWLKFMFTQFITNALKYTFDKNKKIFIQAKVEDEQVMLTVQDEGIGIPKSDLSRVTKAFFTGENGRKTGESTGMGLYIAQEICSRLGHKLDIVSEVNQGTTVTVRFQQKR